MPHSGATQSLAVARGAIEDSAATQAPFPPTVQHGLAPRMKGFAPGETVSLPAWRRPRIGAPLTFATRCLGEAKDLIGTSDVVARDVLGPWRARLNRMTVSLDREQVHSLQPTGHIVMQSGEPSDMRIGGRDLSLSPVFDTYWRFASERQRIYEQRIAGVAGPWTADPILQDHRFTNPYRAADRVSQYLIRSVTYSGIQDPVETVFRTLLFKFFNRIETWQLLERSLGTQPSWADFSLDEYDEILSTAFKSGQRIYSPAYVMAPPRLGAERKHTNHLRLLQTMLAGGFVEQLTTVRTMKAAFELLTAQPSIGDFLAFQFLIDLNYSNVLAFDEMDFVVAGPGAKDGIRKCFGPNATGIEAEIIQYMSESQDDHFDRLGLTFRGLRGRRLHLIDCQNLFCEVDKYSRVAHPSIQGISGRTRIKQKFRPVLQPVDAWFPPKWNLNNGPGPFDQYLPPNL